MLTVLLKYLSQNLTCRTIWWSWMPGITIDLKWSYLELEQLPTGVIKVHYSSPDDYKSWLDSNVGLQGWDWDWQADNGHLKIKFRKGKTEYATVAALMWS